MRRLLVSLALFAATLGCGKEPTVTPPISEIVGSYSLATVNGATLPFTWAQNGADKAEVIDDVITLHENGEWTEIWHDRYTESGVVTTEESTDEGVFTRVGNRLTLTSSFGGTVFADLTTTSITMAGNGFTLIYSR
jgi:hypothetical protein